MSMWLYFIIAWCENLRRYPWVQTISVNWTVERLCSLLSTVGNSVVISTSNCLDKTQICVYAFHVLADHRCLLRIPLGASSLAPARGRVPKSAASGVRSLVRADTKMPRSWRMSDYRSCLCACAFCTPAVWDCAHRCSSVPRTCLCCPLSSPHSGCLSRCSQDSHCAFQSLFLGSKYSRNLCFCSWSYGTAFWFLFI